MEKVLNTSKKKILVVSQYFWPEDFRVNELVSKLSERGHQIDVLTGYPNYPKGVIFPDFKKNPKKFNKFNNIKIFRAKHKLRGQTKLSLALNYFSFAISASIYAIFLNKRNRYDCVIGVQLSPIFSVLPGIISKKLFKTKLYLWVFDIWPDSVYTTNVQINKFFKFVLDKICKFIYSSPEILFITSKGFKERLINMKVSSPKYVYLPQWVEDSYMENINEKNSINTEVKNHLTKWSNSKIFMFAGNIGEAQDFKSLIMSFKKVRCKDDWVFLILGEGRYKANVIKLIRQNKLEDNIFCLGKYPAEYMPFFYKEVDFLIVSLKNFSVFSNTLPGKVQSYMSSGKHRIGMIQGETARVIDDANCGFTVPSGDIDAFSSLIKRCIKQSNEERKKIGENGRVYSLREFNCKKLIDKIESFL